MAEAQERNASGAMNENAKKRKGFWSKLFSKSSNKKDEQEQKSQGGFMDSLRSAAAKEVAHVAVHEGTQEVHKLMNDNNGSGGNDSGSQPTTTTPDVSSTSPSDALDSSTSWAKRMVGNAQQKMQGLQGLGS